MILWKPETITSVSFLEKPYKWEEQLTFEVEIEALIQLKRPVIVLPILAEEVQKPFLRDLRGTLYFVPICRGVVS